MSYAQQTITPAQRASSVGTVVLIHAGIGALLIVGLNATGVIGERPERIDTFEIPEDKPTPPPPPEPDQPERTEVESVITMPPVPSPIPRPDDFRTPTTDENANEGVTADPNANDERPSPGPSASPSASPSPSPSPPPLFDPLPPRPSNEQGGWVTARDYPTIELRRGNEGVTAYRLSVSSSGRVSACQVTRSSGHARLDEEACDSITRRARFTPAQDRNGNTVVGTYTGQVRWQIPR